MAYVNRTDEQLTTALEAALTDAYAPDTIVVRRANGTCHELKTQFTREELLNELRQKTEFGLKFLEAIRECARKGDRDPLDWIGHYSKSK